MQGGTSKMRQPSARRSANSTRAFAAEVIDFRRPPFLSAIRATRSRNYAAAARLTRRFQERNLSFPFRCGLIGFFRDPNFEIGDGIADLGLKSVMAFPIWDSRLMDLVPSARTTNSAPNPPEPGGFGSVTGRRRSAPQPKLAEPREVVARLRNPLRDRQQRLHHRNALPARSQRIKRRLTVLDSRERPPTRRATYSSSAA